MIKKICNFLNIYYPQNYLIRHPLQGALIISLFLFGFSALYKPSDSHASGTLSYAETMAIYSLIGGASLILFIRILKYITWFRSINSWTLKKEFLSVLIILSGTCTVVYLMGFLIEEEAQRWTIRTFLNSYKNVFSVGIIPFAFFSAINYRFLLSNITRDEAAQRSTDVHGSDPPEDMVQISSQLKKEELKFYPSQFLFAESEGNYVVFHLSANNQVRKQAIRNSITNIEQQLSVIPFFFRTHRSFIVNLKKVKSKQGNILGYQLKLSETEAKIPVSRERTKIFSKELAKYHPH
jgi:hypothetical protein